MKRRVLVTRSGLVCFKLAAIAAVGLSQAHAATLLFYAATTTSVIAYYSDGTKTTLPAPSGGWADAYALAVDSTGNNLYVADAGASKVYQIENLTTTPTLNPTALTTLSGFEGISPQEIALDGSGNLWTLTFGGNGNVQMYASATGTGTSETKIPSSRGILIVGSTVYVSSSSLGDGLVAHFNTSTPGTISYDFESGAYPAGQLRGMAAAGTTLYVADSGWNTDGSASYIEALSSGGSSVFLPSGTKGLDNPNSIAVSGGSLYVANYGSGDVTEYSLTSGTLLNTYVITGTPDTLQGLVFPGSAADGGAAEPEFFGHFRSHPRR